MFKNKNFLIFPVIFLLIGCSSGDDDNIALLEASVSSSNDAPAYDETYTISWQSNASQCYATSTTGSWLGELETSGSREFVAKRKGIANYGIQCRTSINFVNASTEIEVTKDFIDYFDFDDVETFDLGSLEFGIEHSLEAIDTSIGYFNDDLFLDIVILLEDSKSVDDGDSQYHILAFYGQDMSSISAENPYTFSNINTDNCAANQLIRLDFDEDGATDLMAVSSSSEESINKRGICFFRTTEEGLVLQDEEYLTNETQLDLSNVSVGPSVLYDVNSNFRPDVMLVGNGGTTDLPFYIIPSEEGPFVQLSNPLSSLNPYTRSNGCIEGISYLCNWVEKQFDFASAVLINADGDGIPDTIFSIKTTDGPLYNLYNLRVEDVYFDWSTPVEDYINSGLISGDGYAVRMIAIDGNLDGLTDLLSLEKSTSSNTYKFSIYEKNVSEDDSINEISRLSNGDLANEYLFDGSLKFSNEFLNFDVDRSGFADIFIPYTELPYNADNIQSDKHFIAFEKSFTVNDDETNTQDWIEQDFSDLIGLDPNSVNNFWIDFDNDNDIDVLLLIPEVSNDNQTIIYNFKAYLNNSLF